MKTYESKITLFPSQHLVEKSKKKMIDVKTNSFLNGSVKKRGVIFTSWGCNLSNIDNQCNYHNKNTRLLVQVFRNVSLPLHY